MTLTRDKIDVSSRIGNSRVRNDDRGSYDGVSIVPTGAILF